MCNLPAHKNSLALIGFQHLLPNEIPGKRSAKRPSRFNSDFDTELSEQLAQPKRLPNLISASFTLLDSTPHFRSSRTQPLQPRKSLTDQLKVYLLKIHLLTLLKDIVDSKYVVDLK